MSVTISIPTALRSECGGLTELALSVASVREALERLEREYPKLYRSVCNETGALRQHVNLFVNQSLLHQREQGFETPLSPGDVLTIMPAVSGG